MPLRRIAIADMERPVLGKLPGPPIAPPGVSRLRFPSRFLTIVENCAVALEIHVRGGKSLTISARKGGTRFGAPRWRE